MCHVFCPILHEVDVVELVLCIAGHLLVYTDTTLDLACVGDLFGLKVLILHLVTRV
jgi:hypothetical protein